MRRKIMGVTVGTPTSPKKIKDEIKPVQTVNGVKPDENGNVEISVSGGGGINQETDPTVPDWAKQATKPKYTAEEVGARPADWTPTETDPTVPAWAKQPNPPAESDPTVPAWAKEAKKPAYGWDEIADKPFTNGKLNAECLPDGVGTGGGSENAVEYTEQTLTEEQKAQARENIGAVSYTYGTEDLIDGVSPLEPGTMYFVP